MKVPYRVRELISVLFVSAAFLLLIPPVPSVESAGGTSMGVRVAAVVVFLLGLGIGWRRGDSIAINALKAGLFVAYVFLLSLRAGFG